MITQPKKIVISLKNPSKVSFKYTANPTRKIFKLEYSRIFINTDPSGAEIFVNGFKIGYSPCIADYLPEGKYHIKAVHRFHEIEKRDVILGYNKRKSINIPMIRSKGDLKISTVPDSASIYIDGVKNIHKTPYFFQSFPAGKYDLKIELDGYHPVSKTINLESGKNEEMLLHLKKIHYGYLYIENLPKGAHVGIDNFKKDFSQGMILEPGKYKLNLSAPYHISRETFVTITEGHKAVVDGKLYKGGSLLVNTGQENVMLWLVNENMEFKNGSVLKEAKYKIGVYKTGFEDYFFSVNIQKGKRIVKNINLVPEGRLFVSTIPKETEINIKGIWDKFHQGIYLPKGEYQLELQAKELPLIRKKILIESGKELKLNLNLHKFQEPYTGMKFVWVGGGCYDMGCKGDNDCESDEKPEHNVCVDGFWMGVYEVTQGEWKKVMGENPSGFKRENGAKFPVEMVSWEDSITFINEMNIRSEDKYYKFSLPTEAQWEYAARSRGLSEKFSGGNKINSLAWYSDNTVDPHIVGIKDPNYIGLYDMSGNVWEWCLDSYEADAYRLHSRKNPVIVSDKPFKVFRGGSWYSEAGDCRVYNRSRLYSGSRDTGVGLRLVRVLKKN